MAYSGLSPLSDGNILNASWLNQLGDNAAFVAGLAAQVNVPFVCETTVIGGDFTYKYKARHLHRYLHYLITQDASQSDDLFIKYNGTTIFHDSGDRSAVYTWSGHIDLEDTGIITGITYGDWYTLYADVTQKTGSGVTTLHYLLESPSTSL